VAVLEVCLAQHPGHRCDLDGSPALYPLQDRESPGESHSRGGGTRASAAKALVHFYLRHHLRQHPGGACPVRPKPPAAPRNALRGFCEDQSQSSHTHRRHHGQPRHQAHNGTRRVG
ncbi:unnamed protein product, partial [Effrenium voratum]